MAAVIDRFRTDCLPGVFVCTESVRAANDDVCCPQVIIAPKLGTGTGMPNDICTVFTADDAARLAGAGSVAHKMVECYLNACPNADLRLITVEPVDGSTAATGDIEILSDAVTAGTAALYIGGELYNFAVATGTSKADVALTMATTINADPNRLVDATVVGDVVTLTARNTGLIGNDLSIAFDTAFGEETPFATGHPQCMMGGAGFPDICEALDALGDCCYEVVISPFCDTASVNCLEEWADRQWACEEKQRGTFAIGKCGTFGDHLAFLDERNNPHGLYAAFCKHSVYPVWQMLAGAMGAGMCQLCSDDPTPWRGLPVPCSSCEDDCTGSCFSDFERDRIICDGGSTFKCVNGCLVWERAVTMNTTNAKGQTDRFWRDFETNFKVSRLVREFVEFADPIAGAAQVVSNIARLRTGTRTTTPALMKAEFFASIADLEGSYFEDIQSAKRFSAFWRDTDTLVENPNGTFSVVENDNPDGDATLVRACLSFDLSNGLQRFNMTFKPTLQRVN